MPSVYQLKPAFQRALRPVVPRLAATGVTANQVTLAAMALSIAAGIALAAWPGHAAPLLCLPVVLLVRMALNAVDGMLAREHGQESRLGAALNEIGDVVADCALYLPLALAWPGAAWLVVLFAAGAVIAEMAGVVAVQIGARRRYDGPLGKSDRAIVIGALAFVDGIGVPTAAWIAWVLGLACVLTAVTIANRVRAAVAEADTGS